MQKGKLATTCMINGERFTFQFSLETPPLYSKNKKWKAIWLIEIMGYYVKVFPKKFRQVLFSGRSLNSDK